MLYHRYWGKCDPAKKVFVVQLFVAVYGSAKKQLNSLRFVLTVIKMIDDHIGGV